MDIMFYLYPIVVGAIVGVLLSVPLVLWQVSRRKARMYGYLWSRGHYRWSCLERRDD